jgi:hypothetical protein
VKKEMFTLITLILLLTVNVNTVYSQETSETQMKPQHFMYLAEIEESMKQNKLYRIHIASEIIKKCSTDLKDIRLFNENNQEIPFVLLKNKVAAEPAKVFNFKIIGYEEEDTCSILTMKTPVNIPAVDSVDIITSERNFKKNVYIYGSGDGQSWKRLAEDFIYDFSAQVDLRKTKLQLPGVKYAFFRLRLCNTQKPKSDQTSFKLRYEQLDFSVEKITEKKLRIERISGGYGTPQQDKTVYDKEIFNDYSIITNNPDKTVIELEAGMPCSKITFDIKNANFFRYIKVYGKRNNDDTFNNIPIATQSVYRFSLGEMDERKHTIICPASNYRIYRFEIKNKNSPPLKIKSITLHWVQTNLYFIGLNDADRCKLYFGSKSTIPAPDYDISAFLRQDNISSQEHIDLKVGPMMMNTDYTPLEKADKKSIIEKHILKLVVILLVILIGFWFYKLYKKI